jgi:hypothetical protein
MILMNTLDDLLLPKGASAQLVGITTFREEKVTTYKSALRYFCLRGLNFIDVRKVQVGRTPDLGDEFMRRPSSDRNGVPRNPQSVH